MRRILCVGLSGAMALACSSESTGAAPGGCADVTGNWSVQVARIGGSCPPTGDGDATVTISKGDEGYGIVLPGIEGICPAELDATTCKLTALCKIVDTKSGSNLATYNLSYTFSGNTFTGSLAGTLSPPIVTEACDANVKHDGTRL